MALALYNDVTIAEDDGVRVTVEGYGVGELPADASNVVARGVRLAYEAAGRSFRGCVIHCVNRIPPSRGLGSSAAAWVGGLVGGNALLGAPLDRRTLLALATRSEGHPDNVAAALHGGLTVSCATDREVIAVALPVPSDLQWVVLIPDVTSATSEARAVLPSSVPRADAVFNVQRVALLLAGLQMNLRGALRAALDDRLHQPYRLTLFPWMPSVVHAAIAAGALGCVLSGAGPSLLAVVAEDASTVARAMENTAAEAGITGVARAFPVDTAGATVVDDPA